MQNLPLDQHGAQAKGHVFAGDRSLDKAEQHYKAAGIHLAAAKQIVLKTKGMTWPVWVVQNIKISRSRADELIMIGNGVKTLEEIRGERRARDARCDEANRSARSASTAAGGKSSEKTQGNQRKVQNDEVEEAVELAERKRKELLTRITARLSRATTEELELIEKTIGTMLG